MAPPQFAVELGNAIQWHAQHPVDIALHFQDVSHWQCPPVVPEPNAVDVLARQCQNLAPIVAPTHSSSRSMAGVMR